MANSIRVNQGLQQDHTGAFYNVIATYDSYGNKKTTLERIEADDKTEVIFNLKLAKGHKWYLTSKTMRVEEEHSAEECGICAKYLKAQATPIVFN